MPKKVYVPIGHHYIVEAFRLQSQGDLQRGKGARTFW